jgi:hypothetical protein
VPATGSSVEQYQAEGASAAPPDAQHAGPAQSPAQLQAQAARLAAQQKLMTRAMTAVDDGLELAAKRPGEPGFSAVFEREARASAAFQEAVKTVPREQLLAAIEDKVRKTQPGITEEGVKEIAQMITAGLEDGLRTDAALGMQKQVCGQLRSAADSFRKTAADGPQLTKLCATLARLEGPGATDAQKAQAASLRAGLGVKNDGQPVTPERLAPALTARAALMSKEAFTMEGRGAEGSLSRSLLTHDVSASYLKAAGIAPGSFAAQGVAAVKARGEADEASIDHAKIAASVALSVASAGMGLGALGVIGAAGMSAGLGAPSVLAAYEEVDSAAAGASAGTAAPDAQAHAEHTAHTKAQGLVLEAVAEGAMSKMSHAVEKPIEEGLIELREAWVQLAEIGGSTGMTFASAHHETTDAAEHPRGRATGRSGVERASE